MSNADSKGEKPFTPSPRLTLCLAMDLKGSTTAGLKLSSRRLDRFNLALVNQLGPYLEAVELDNALIKFAGDGWVIMSDDPSHAAPLCCLAMIMAKRFQLDMGEEVSLAPSRIPALRLGISWVRDMRVKLPNGQWDFVGDSARHAVRACQLCHDNEVLIDETVYRWVNRDFVATPVDLQKRLATFPNVKMEEELVLHRLQELNMESAEEEDAPVCFLNTLSVIGRRGAAEALATRISDHLQMEVEEKNTDKDAVLERFNQLLASKLDYETTSSILRDMRAAGLVPNVDTFNALITKAKDHATQRLWMERMGREGIEPNTRSFNMLIKRSPDKATIDHWLRKMSDAGIQPDIETLNILVRKAQDHDTAAGWLDQMKQADVWPNASTFNSLIEKAKDLKTAMAWIDQMFAAEIQPSIISFLNAFSKDLTTTSGEELLSWYLMLPYHPPEPIHRAIAAYRRSGHIDNALRLALDYPYTEAALRVIRENPEQALAYFRSIVEDEPEHANGAYALGIALVELGQPLDAKPWLQKALDLAAPGPRREAVTRYLELVSEKTNTPLSRA